MKPVFRNSTRMKFTDLREVLIEPSLKMTIHTELSNSRIEQYLSLLHTTIERKWHENGKWVIFPIMYIKTGSGTWFNEKHTRRKIIDTLDVRLN